MVKGEEILFEKGYGLEGTARQEAVDPQMSLFRAASVSKLFTTVAVLQLVQQGRLNLDEDIRAYVGREGTRGYGGGTLAHLLTHTSGIEDPFFSLTMPRGKEHPSLGSYFAIHPPHFARLPGRQMAYSNLGMALAGHLVEVTSGLPFEDYMEQYLLQPLGMARSSFRQPYPNALAPHVVPSGADESLLIAAPSGALIAPVHDVGRFIIALVALLMVPFLHHWNLLGFRFCRCPMLGGRSSLRKHQ